MTTVASAAPASASRWSAGDPALGAAEERRPELDAFGAERECGGDAAAVHDPAGEQAPGTETRSTIRGTSATPPTTACSNGRGTCRGAARLAGLGDHRVHAEPLAARRPLDRRRRAEDDAARLPYRLERENAEREAEHRHALVGDHCELRLEQPRRRSRGTSCGSGSQARRGAARGRPASASTASLDLGRRQRREEVDRERPVGQPAIAAIASRARRARAWRRRASRAPRVQTGLTARRRKPPPSAPGRSVARPDGAGSRPVSRPPTSLRRSTSNATITASPGSARRRPAARAGRSRGSARAGSRRSRTTGAWKLR